MRFDYTNANTNSNIHTHTIVIPDIDTYFLKITKSVCKIEYNENYFSGFLLKIPKDQDNENYFFCLMACSLFWLQVPGISRGT